MVVQLVRRSSQRAEMSQHKPFLCILTCFVSYMYSCTSVRKNVVSNSEWPTNIILYLRLLQASTPKFYWYDIIILYLGSWPDGCTADCKGVFHPSVNQSVSLSLPTPDGATHPGPRAQQIRQSRLRAPLTTYRPWVIEKISTAFHCSNYQNLANEPNQWRSNRAKSQITNSLQNALFFLTDGKGVHSLKGYQREI